MIMEKERFGRMIAVAIGAGAIALICFAVYFIPELQVFSLSERVKNMNVELSFYSDVKDINNRLKETEAKLVKRKGILEEVSKGEVDIAMMLEKLTTAAPKNVVLSYFSTTGGGNINASYIINNPIEANQLEDNLKKLNIFEKVEMPAIPIVDRRTEANLKLTLKSDNTITGIKK